MKLSGILLSAAAFLFVAILATAKTTAAPVTFWYGGYIKAMDDRSNASPFTVSVGMPFTGRITYDDNLDVGQTNAIGSGQYSIHRFANTAGFSLLLQLGNHVLTNGPLEFHNVGAIFVYDDGQNEDALLFETGANLMLDGSTLVTNPVFSAIDIDLADATKTSITAIGLPATAPDLAKFTKRREMRWGIYYDDGGPSKLFSVTGQITVISTNEIVFLHHSQPTPNAMVMSWPKLNAGFSLQFTTNPTGNIWQNELTPVVDVGLEHTVTVATTGAPRYYRLEKLFQPPINPKP